MIQYANLSGDSGVSSYEIKADAIHVKFKGRAKVYRYHYGTAGRTHVEQMKQLAVEGRGLNAYINRYVKSLYE